MTQPSAAPALRRLPSGGEFSPGQISLRRVLDLAADTAGDRAAFTEALRLSYFAEAAAARTDPQARLKQQKTRAGNVVIGMGTYGLYDSSVQGLTEFGEALRAEPEDQRLYERFARHIIVEKQGAVLLDAVRSLQRRGQRPSKTALADELRNRRGFTTLPQATTHHLTMLNWLAEAGVVSGRVRAINEDVLQRVVGATSDVMHQIRAMPTEQRAFLDAVQHLVRGQAELELHTQQVEIVAAERNGNVLGPDDRRKRVIRDPLEAAGWISVAGTGPGRGGKGGTVRPTAKLLELDPKLLNSATDTELPADLIERLDTPLDQIYADLQSSDTHVKGLALELLAVTMASDLGLTPVALRFRAIEAGGTEVDLIAENHGTSFTRWVFQCKNTRSVSAKVAIREIGILELLHAQTAVVVTTGNFAGTASAVRDTLAESTDKQMVLVDGKVLERYQRAGGQALISHFRAASEHTARVKSGQVKRLLERFDSAT